MSMVTLPRLAACHPGIVYAPDTKGTQIECFAMALVRLQQAIYVDLHTYNVPVTHTVCMRDFACIGLIGLQVCAHVAYDCMHEFAMLSPSC